MLILRFSIYTTCSLINHLIYEMSILSLDSLEMMMEEHKPIKGKQQNVSDEHKENLDPDTQPEIPRNDKRILSKCYQTREVAVSSKSVEKFFQTKSLHHPSTQEVIITKGNFRYIVTLLMLSTSLFQYSTIIQFFLI